MEKEITIKKSINIPEGKELVDLEVVLHPVFKDILKQGDIFYSEIKLGNQHFIGVYHTFGTPGIVRFDDHMDSDWQYSPNVNIFSWDKSTERKVTKNEYHKFIELLRENGYDYDKDSKSIIPYKWVPTERERYWYVSYDSETAKFGANSLYWENDSVDNTILNNRFGIFKTREECQEKCDELNYKICQK